MTHMNHHDPGCGRSTTQVHLRPTTLQLLRTLLQLIVLIVVRQHILLVMLKVGNGVRADAVVDCCKCLEGIEMLATSFVHI